MSACGPREPGVEALPAARGSAPPFLPTLVTAFAIGAASLLCRQPSAPEMPAAPIAVAEASPVGADGFHPAPGAPQASVPIPAVLAFSQVHPLMPPMPRLAEADETRVPPARGARVAVAVRRPCATARCGEAKGDAKGDAKRGETIRSASSAPPPARPLAEPSAAPARGEPETDEGFIPEGALPFASTAASWLDGARKLGGSIGGSVRSGAVSLGGSVVDLVASAR